MKHMEKNNITAVEWFFNQLSEKTQANNEKEYYQAKQMEKEQIKKAFSKGHFNGYAEANSTLSKNMIWTPETYYKDTYEK